MLQAVRRVHDDAVAAGRDPAGERMLILCDCAPVVEQVERAYRAGRTGGLQEG